MRDELAETHELGLSFDGKTPDFAGQVLSGRKACRPENMSQRGEFSPSHGRCPGWSPNGCGAQNGTSRSWGGIHDRLDK